MSANDLLVEQQSEDQDYGLLMYDIPEDHQTLYSKIHRRLRGQAICLNYSVYLFMWGRKSALEGVIAECKAEVPDQRARVLIAKFDNSSREDLRRDAKQAMVRELVQIRDRLLKTIEQNISDNKDHIREAYAHDIQKRLEEAEALAMLFGLTHDIRHAMEAVHALFAGQLEKVLDERSQRRTARRAATEQRRAVRQKQKEYERAQKVAIREARKASRRSGNATQTAEPSPE